MSNNTTTTNNNNEPKPYTGPVKYIWKDGQNIRVPDVQSPNLPYGLPEPGTMVDANSTHRAQPEKHTYSPKLDQILSQNDIDAYAKLSNDEARYDYIRSMINGLDDSPEHKIYNSSIGAYVNGDYRGLQQVLQDLIDRKIIYLHSNGNLYHYKYALENKLILASCVYCSKVVDGGPDELRMHMYSHQARRR